MSESAVQAQPAAPSRGPSTLQLVIVVAILASGIVLTALTSDVSKVSEPGVKLVEGQPFLPEKAGPWTGSEQTGLTPDERALLPADTEGGRRIYSDDKGHQVYCSIVLAGRDVTSIHRPELCLKGQGWQLAAPRTLDIATPAARGGELRVSRMDATRMVPMGDGRSGQMRTEFVYWFVGKDRTTPYHWQRILWTTEDRVFHNRNHRWAYFLINTPVDPSLAAQDPSAGNMEAVRVVGQFIQDIYPSLVAN
jgi:hypothetical protein